VVDTQTVAVFHGIQDLEKRLLDKPVIAHVPTPLRDIGEKVALWTVFQYDVCAIWVVHNLEHGNYVRVCRGCVVKLNLPGLELPLSSIQRFSIGIGFAQGFHSIPGLGAMIEGRIHNSIRSRPQYPLQLQRLPKVFTYP
jgi:hypothetical protein